MIASLKQDCRYAGRVLSRNKLFTLAAVLVIALGTGANTAVFSFVDAVLLRPLPVRDPGSLILLTTPLSNGQVLELYSYPHYVGLRDLPELFSDLYAIVGDRVDVNIDNSSESMDIDFVSGNYFKGLGIGAEEGRVLRQSDDSPLENRVVVLSHSFWERRFGAGKGTVGRALVIGDQQFTVAGIVPEGFYGTIFGAQRDAWMPLSGYASIHHLPPAAVWNDPGRNFIQIMGRASNMTLQQVSAASSVVFSRINTEGIRAALKMNPNVPPAFVKEYESRRIVAVRGAQGGGGVRRDSRLPLTALAAIATLIFLLACANVSGLVLVHNMRRQKEVAVRLALGARAGRLFRQIIAENVLLGVFGGLLGIGFAELIRRLFATQLRDIGPLTAINWRVLGFMTGITLITSLIIGFFPTLCATKIDVNTALKEEGITSGWLKTNSRSHAALVIAQVAMSLVLLICAGLFLQTLVRLYRTNLGFQYESTIMATVQPGRAHYDHERSIQFWERLLQNVRTEPGTTDATICGGIPLSGRLPTVVIQLQGYQPKATDRMQFNFDTIDVDYFRTLGIPLLSGRSFEARDIEDGPRVVIINETLAQQFFGNDNPIGRHLSVMGRPDLNSVQIVGVAKDARLSSIKEQVEPMAFFPYRQFFVSPLVPDTMTLLVRTRTRPTAVIPIIRKAVRAIDSMVPIFDAKTMETQLDESLHRERLMVRLSLGFGALALTLAGVGAYGLIAQSVGQRRREIGIRIALGATPRGLVWIIVRRTLQLIGAGLLVGYLLSLAATRMIANQLYGVQSSDPLTYLAAIVLLFAIAALAAVIPARLAAAANPSLTLRRE